MHRRVALIAYSHRFPGTDTRHFWNDLLEKKDLVTEVDSARWAKETFLHPDKRHPGTSYTFSAGSLGDISGFDADFFGISPREAALMDPQQRLLLELAWETFENAGILPSSLRGSDCGVYIGISNVDYAYRLADDLAAVESAAATGIISSIAANRISYVFDLHGPSISMDTACSSSLVAFHQACLAIRAGDISQALAGGINLHLHPYGFISFSKATMLSKTGRCHVFDESGDGYVRSEGGGLFLLKDYDLALADGDEIIAEVAGSAVNTDGHKSGLTIPNPLAQATLMSHVYEKAGISPDAIDYFEAHGTGTAVGDPIETHAIGLALGQKRQRPLLIGSVKSNLGHLESASGVAGLVKALNCIQHRAVPATIGVNKVNPNIKINDWNLRVVTETLPLKAKGNLIVGVNSFGFGGANAHVILQSHTPPPRVYKKRDKLVKANKVPLVLFAKNAGGLRQAALDMAGFLENSAGTAFYDIAHTAFFRRDRHKQGVVVFSNQAKDAAEQLKCFAEERSTQTLPSPCTGNYLADAKGPVFIYSGNGCQWAGMGKQLLEQSPTFRRTLTEIDTLFSQYADFSLLDELAGINGDRYERTEIAQPALFALQVGITEVLKENGIRPLAVTGHSVGEVAAAWACGALSLAAAVKVIFYRSYHQGKTNGLGGMTAVGLSADSMALLLDKLGLNGLSLAGINSYRGVTVAGSIGQLAAMESELAVNNTFFKRLALDYPFHSAAMDGIESGLREDLALLETTTPTISFWSTVTGNELLAGKLDAEYWWHNIRQPVQFQQVVDAMLAKGLNTLIEIGAHPVLQNYLKDSLKATDSNGVVIATATRNHATATQLMDSVAQVILSGAPVDLQHWFPAAGQFISLPNYPWQREKLWHPVTAESQGLLMRTKVHPLLGYPLRQHALQWENQLDTQSHPYLADHNVGGAVVFPGAGFVELALAAAYHAHAGNFIEIEELEIRSPLLLSHEQSKVIRFALDAADGRFTLRSRELAKSSEWQAHSVGRVLAEATGSQLAVTAPAIPNRAPDFNQASHAAATESIGLEYGAAFQAIDHGWVDGNQVLGVFSLPEVIRADIDRYYLHPALLDCAFQLVFQILKEAVSEHEDMAFVPIKMGRIHLRANKAVPVLAQATLLHCSPHSLNTEFTLYDAQGQAIAVINDVRFRAVRLHRQHVQQLSYLDYHLTAAPLAGTAPFKLTPTVIQKTLAEAVGQGTDDRYVSEVEPLLDSLCQQFICEGLASLADDSGFLSATLLQEHSEGHPEVANMLRALIDFAGDNQTLDVVEGRGWQLNKEGLQTDISATAIWAMLIREYPDYFYLVHLVGRVGMQLPSLLTGVLQTEDIGITSALYATIHSYILEQTNKKTLAGLISQCYGQITQSLSSGERLRVLEISAHQPEFAALLCPQVDFSESDYCFASHNDHALSMAEGLREHFPLLKTLRLPTVSETVNQTAEERSNFAIINLAMGNVQEVQHLLNSLPKLLMPGSPVLIMGLQPARWVDMVLGGTQGWWLHHDDQSLFSPQLSANEIAEQLQALGFNDTQIYHFMPEQYAGNYLLTASIADNVAAPVTETKNWLILADDQNPSQALAATVAARLSQQGHAVVVQGGLFADQVDMAAYHHIVHLSGLAQADAVVQNERCWLASQLIQSLETVSSSATVWLVTSRVSSLFSSRQNSSDGLAVPPRPIANDAALWGFGRSLMNEAASYQVQLLDINGDMDKADLLNALVHELLHGGTEQEIILTAEGKRFAPRLRSEQIPDSYCNKPPIADASAVTGQTLRLGFKTPGQLRNLHWQAIAQVAPADDEIEVDVKATGLNFRDVMYTLGLLSDEAVENGFVGPSLGLEFAGLVVRVGRQVTAFKPGDQVVGFGSASFSNRVLTKASAIAVIPNAIGYAAAATIPSTFFTVYYALHHQARLQKGEKVLIHGAAGGVGLAAIQVARWLGAEIYATVGSDEKRDFLQLLGIAHIHDSRSLSFAEEILAKTDNCGVDVVLNSLAGEAINRNFQVLKPFGRFLELGKRDFYENTAIGLRPFRNNISYFGIDADQLMKERPELTRVLFNEMMQLFDSGVLYALPYTTFDANQVVDAFRYMQQAKQIGKIVVTYDNGIYAQPTVETAAPPMPLTLSAQASYLVTGGLGGFGLRTAQWLVEKGARHLILLSRSGPVSAEAKAALAEFDGQGVIVRAASCDVTDKAALTLLLEQCAVAMPPLAGIVHAATVIEDSLVRNLTDSQIGRVLSPKIQGALNLHELTLDRPLDFFVLYSSITTLFGNPGQSSYVAGNLWLEALAANRRQQGLTATCVRWGAIDDVGFLARNVKIKDALQSRMGGAALSSARALAVLEDMLVANCPTLGVMEFDWRALGSFLPTARSPKFRELAMHSPNADGHDDNRADIKRLLDELSTEELKATFIDMLKDELSQILLINKDKIDPDQSMYDMGLDSLMGVELMIALETRFEVQVPVMALSESPTLSRLADRLITQLRGTQAPAETSDTVANINDLAKRHDSGFTADQLVALAEALEVNGSSKIITH
ncbi:MAG: SDR family NAD(P)-dependent oxidoreductase [Methylovulum sp.]|nr:SDR family NAD(P)-dependent oxidoreductase [Methylovulum sp.]